jgi:hypothetical protein
MHYVAIDPSPVHTAVVSQEWHQSRGYLLVDGQTYPILRAVTYIISSVSVIQNMQEEVTFIVERPPQTPRGMTIESQQTIASYWIIIAAGEDRQSRARFVETSSEGLGNRVSFNANRSTSA